jgi:S1-C subfamily serine protease
MHPWTANLIGLALGLTVGGSGLALVLPLLEKPAEAPVSQAARPTPALPQVITPAQPAIQPAEMPQIITPPPPRPEAALPNVVYPDAPEIPEPEPSHKPGTAIAGTGFFVASDATLITAAHVVPGCRQTRIVSNYIRPAVAQVLATDKQHDIALLRAANVTPPALLTLGRPAAPGDRLFVLGYPATGGPKVATAAWGVLENSHLQPASADLVDPRRTIWADAPVVTHGFSGGPMLDPRNGAVVGIVRAGVDSTRLHAKRAIIPASGMIIGPGSAELAALLREQGTDSGDAVAASGDDALDTARRATVHVICMF